MIHLVSWGLSKMRSHTVRAGRYLRYITLGSFARNKPSTHFFAVQLRMAIHLKPYLGLSSSPLLTRHDFACDMVSVRHSIQIASHG
jgi:hypothetical protein